jgi:hypothetical protein
MSEQLVSSMLAAPILTANAQVGEWLKPADCKSAPPSEVRRFESFPVHQIFASLVVTKKLVLALTAYVALAVLALSTLTDPKIRAATLVILAMFAVKTWVRRGDVMHPGGESGSDQ